MAVTPGAQRGKTPYQVNGAEAIAPVQLGNSASLIFAAATTATATLPTDPQGNAYPCYRFKASSAQWYCFGSGPAVPGAASTYLIGPGIVEDVFAPAGSTQVSAIPADAVTTGSFSIVGLY
jgi:hypothetical protein